MAQFPKVAITAAIMRPVSFLPEVPFEHKV